MNNMTKNPFYNALLANIYIISLISIAFAVPKFLGEPKDSILFPMGALSVLVFSAALMAYLFFYQPVLMLLDGKREEAIKLFLQTLGVFAGVTGIIFLISLAVNF